MVLFWLHLASTNSTKAAPEAGLRARVGPATVNTRFNSGVLTCTFWSLPWGCSCGCPGRRWNGFCSTKSEVRSLLWTSRP